MRTNRWAAIMLGLALASCSSGPKEAPIQHATPVTFDIPTGKIDIAPVTVSLPPRRGIGTYYRNVDCWVQIRPIMPADFPSGNYVATEIQNQMRRSRLNASISAANDVESAGDADYLLQATIPTAHADLCVNDFFNSGPADIDAQVAVSWKLWSVRDKRVVYENTTTGTARASDPAQTINAGVAAAVDDATLALLQTAAIQQYLTYGRVIAPAASESGGQTAPVPTGGAAPIPQPPAGIQRPADAFTPILVPVKPSRAGSQFDPAAARRATVTLGNGKGGLVLGEGYLLTASTPLGATPSVRVQVGGGRTLDAQIVRQDAALGVALLLVDGTLPPGLPLQPRHNAPGDEIFGVGAEGTVQGTFTGIRTIKLDGALAGGPVLDPAGNVIGILLPDGGFASIGTVFRTLRLGAQPTED